MKRLMVIDACMHEGSRTRKILEPVVAELSKRYSVEKIVLEADSYPVVGKKILNERSSGYVPPEIVETAKRIASAERLVIAAPFWDMSYPSALKVFFENMSLFNITFANNGKEFTGLCKCEKVLYITTRGMNIKTGEALEQATPYIRALSRLWGLGELTVIAEENMDYSTPEEIEAKIRDGIERGIEIARDF